MRLPTLRSVFKAVSVLVVLSIALSTAPAMAAPHSPSAPTSQGQTSDGLLLERSSRPLQEESALSEERWLSSQLVLPLITPMERQPVDHGTSSTPEPDALPSDAIPKTTWDELRSKAPAKTILENDSEAVVTPEKGGELRTADGWLRVEFPAGAVSESVKLTYKRAGYAPHPLLDSRDTYFAFGLKAQTLSTGASVRQFARPITITVSYPNGSGIGPQVDLFYWDEESSYWALVPSSIDSVARTITASTSHFTDYALSDANQIEPDLPSLKGFQMDMQTGAATA